MPDELRDIVQFNLNTTLSTQEYYELWRSVKQKSPNLKGNQLADAIIREYREREFSQKTRKAAGLDGI